MTKTHDNIPFIVVSAGRAGDSEQVAWARHEALRTLVEECGAIKDAVGWWMGVAERSLLVFNMDAQWLEDVESLAFNVFDQDAVLWVDANRYTTMHHTGGRTVKGGRWHEVTVDEARGQAHTYVDNRYFVTR